MTDFDFSPTPGSRLTVPKIRSGFTHCKHRGPVYVCNRPAGHGGRHAFSWQHLDGRVRGVWGDR